MPRPKKPSALLEGVEKAAAVLAGFDYGIHPEDFVLYELHRLIEEDRASFDDAEFRTLIDEGIRAHIEDDIEIRARLAGMLRSSPLKGDAKTMALRVVHALEDVEADLCNVAVLVRNYTSYLFARLEAFETNSHDERITTAADLLFESTGDRGAAETALDVLCTTVSPVSARVLAHAVSEPLLDEDLETRAFTALKACWPLSRHYMIYSLRDHPHEDIPMRWFQLFVEVDEPNTVDLVLEELRAHGGNPRYQEDLATLIDQLQTCRDPETEDKILDAVNSESTNEAALPALRRFLEEYSTAGSDRTVWDRRLRDLEMNREYRVAAALFEKGDREGALRALESILKVNPAFAFALMLKQLAL